MWPNHTTEYGARVRHLWSLIAGLVAAPVTWILMALGQSGSIETITRWAETGTFNTARLIEPAVYLAVAGIILGLIATLRISPAGPLAAGLLLVAPYAALFGSPLRVRSAVPGNWGLFGDPLPLRLPLDNGTLGAGGDVAADGGVQRAALAPVAEPAAAGPVHAGAAGLQRPGRSAGAHGSGHRPADAGLPAGRRAARRRLAVGHPAGRHVSTRRYGGIADRPISRQ